MSNSASMETTMNTMAAPLWQRRAAEGHLPGGAIVSASAATTTTTDFKENGTRHLLLGFRDVLVVLIDGRFHPLTICSRRSECRWISRACRIEGLRLHHVRRR